MGYPPCLPWKSGKVMMWGMERSGVSGRCYRSSHRVCTVPGVWIAGEQVTPAGSQVTQEVQILQIPCQPVKSCVHACEISRLSLHCRVCLCMRVSFLQSSGARVSCGVRPEKQMFWPCHSYSRIRHAHGTAERSWDTPPWLSAGDSSSFCRFRRPLLFGQIKPCSSISSNHPLLLFNQGGGGWPMLRKTGKVLWNRGCTDVQAGWG